MANCKDCVCYEPCGKQDKLVQVDDHTWDNYIELDDVEKHCPHFKNKADFQEVKHGHWCNVYMDGPSSFVGTCSECQRTNDIPPPEQARYCISCGAIMDEKVGEE